MADTSMRRVPQQARSQQRIDAILGAAAALFAEVGFEAATTNAIAARAGISIGSLYRYFPNKDAILHALASRYLDELRALHDTVFGAGTAAHALPLPALLERLLDPFIAFYKDRPAFKHIFLGSQVSADLAAASAQMDDEVVEQIKNILLSRAPHLDDSGATLAALVSKSVVKALFAVLDSLEDEALHRQAVAEIKRLLNAYLAPLMEEGST